MPSDHRITVTEVVEVPGPDGHIADRLTASGGRVYLEASRSIHAAV